MVRCDLPKAQSALKAIIIHKFIRSPPPNIQQPPSYLILLSVSRFAQDGMHWQICLLSGPRSRYSRSGQS